MTTPSKGPVAAIGWADGMEMLAWLQERQLMTPAQLGRAAFEWSKAFGEPHGAEPHPPAGHTGGGR